MPGSAAQEPRGRSPSASHETTEAEGLRPLGTSLRWLIALTLLVNFIGLGSHRALTDHEVHLAANAKAMVQTGDWLVPRIGDQTWVEKPPLPQWLEAATAIALGRMDEWSMRLPFALAGVVVVLLVVQIMSRLFGPQIGLLSGFIQATSVYQVTYSRLAEGDVVLQIFVLGAIAVFLSGETQWSVLTSQQQRHHRWGFWALLGATNLVKGIAFGAVLALLTCAGWYLLRSDWRSWRKWWSPSGMLLAFAIAAAWPVATALQEPAALGLWQKHLFGRAAGSLGYTQPWWYYLTTWPSQLLPWTPLLFLALPQARNKVLKSRACPEAFCLWWVLSQMALLSCSSGKHHHYLLYALPALSPLTAQGLVRFGAWLMDPDRRRLWSIRIIRTTGLAMALASIAAAVRGWMSPVEAAVAVLLLMGGCWVIARGVRLHQPHVAWAALLVVIVSGHVLTQVAVMPRRDPSIADKRFLKDVERMTSPDIPLAACGAQEIARHLFYVDRPIVGIWNAADVPEAWPTEPAVYVVTRGHARSELEQWGDVEQVAQSTFTRRERSPDDRYTLFLVRRVDALAERSESRNRKRTTRAVSRFGEIDRQ